MSRWLTWKLDTKTRLLPHLGKATIGHDDEENVMVVLSLALLSCPESGGTTSKLSRAATARPTCATYLRKRRGVDGQGTVVD